MRKIKTVLFQATTLTLFEWRVTLQAVTIGIIASAIVTANLGIGIASVGSLAITNAVSNAHKRWENAGAYQGDEWRFLNLHKVSVLMAILAFLIGGILIVL